MAKLWRLFFLPGLLGFVGAASMLPAAEVAFTTTLSPEELRATGLDRLSEAERARLDALIAQRARPQPARSPTAARTVDESPDSASVPREARISRSREPAVTPRRIESRLEGTFTGWSGSTIFRLENGQRWMQVDGTRYTAYPSRENPEVQVVPAMMGTYFLKIDGVGTRCRVKLLED